MIKAIIFDLDDTICDTSGILNDALRSMAKAMIDAGLPADIDKIDWKKVKGLSGRLTAKNIMKEYGIEDKKILDVGLHEYYGYVENIHFNPYVKEVLESLKKYKLILLTIGIPDTQKKKIEVLGIKRYFEDIIYQKLDYLNVKGSERAKGYDKVESIQKILKKNDLKPEEVISIGDKPLDVESSNKAGVISAHYSADGIKDYHPKNKLQEPDYKIKNMMELMEILK